MSDTVERRVTYNTIVESAWKASCVSPISGNEITAYRDTVEEARRAVDLEIVKEAHAAGLTVGGRFDPRAGESGG